MGLAGSMKLVQRSCSTAAGMTAYFTDDVQSAPPAPPSSSISGSSARSAMLITAEVHRHISCRAEGCSGLALVPHMTCEPTPIGLEALGAATMAAASAAGGFTADMLQASAGSAKAARAAVNCLMKLDRVRCEVKGGQMVYHLRK